jgi:uncharacterized protein
MPLPIARLAVDFLFSQATGEDRIDIGFFGGEPLLEFDLLKSITDLIEKHHGFSRARVGLAVVTNGTIFSDEIADFLIEHHIDFCLSCDGPASVQNTFRRFPSGEETSSIVEGTIQEALKHFPCVLVNAVYHPKTFQYLPDVVEYFASLNLRQIYLNPDFSAVWSESEARQLATIYDRVGQQYTDYYMRGEPRFISLIDSKVTVLLRGGYQPFERCRMGKGEMAVAPDGRVYPCERLIGTGFDDANCIGDVVSGLDLSRMSCRLAPGDSMNTQCLDCGFRDYCMHWCGCSNFFMTGLYNRVGPFLCASEKAAIQTASRVFTMLEEKLGPTFVDHLAGVGHLNTYLR